MKLKRRIKLNERIAIPVLFVILIILLIIYGNIIFKNISYGKFAKQNMEVYENNKEQVFKVEKILICSSANATDLSEKQNLQDMSIYQYTDIAVYINNGEDLSNKNTVKELYIDNISLEGNSDIGKKELNYKNILKFGLKKDTLPKSSTITDMSSEHNVFESLMNNTGNNNTASNDNKSIDVGNIVTNETEESTSEVQENSEYEDDGKIKFNIVYTNEENEKADYNKPTFYTDCSNPITLEYLNNDIATNYKIDENKSVSFDGSILKDAGISTESLACKVKFKINIINNEDEKYSCWINFDIPLDDIYEGTTMKAKSTNNQKYVFFRE
jgi:hypothetical protein